MRSAQNEKRETERLVLVDGNAILHRAYHALPPLTTRSGELVNAVYGFSTMLLKILEDLKPKYLAVAFDTPKPNFRHQEFIGYQAKRKKMDAELSQQIERVRQLVNVLNIPVFEAEGYEADDVIGTLARQAVECLNNKECSSFEVLIVTGDRDLMQLVNDEVKLFMPSRGLSEGQIIGEKEVKERMGVEPQKIIDYKALVGDQSDNYPGVLGIGPKTAISLLEQFGTLDEIYSHLDQIENRNIVEKLREGKESSFLSRKLAAIVTSAPVNLELNKCLASDYDKEKVISFFKELGFRSLISRIGGKTEKKEDRQQSLF